MAGASTNIVVIDNRQMQDLAALSRYEGRLALARALYMKDFDEEDDFRSSIIADYHYNNMLYGMEKGFPWSLISAFVLLARDVLEQSVGRNIQESLAIFKMKMTEIGRYCNKLNAQLIIQYLLDTYFRHYRLYQYVLCHKQLEERTKVKLVIEPPPSTPLPFNTGIPLDKWEYDRDISIIEKKERDRRDNRAIKRIIAEKTSSKMIDAQFQKFDSVDNHLNEEKIAELVNEAASTYITVFKKNLVDIIEDSRENLEYKLTRAARGPPPKSPKLLNGRIKSSRRR